MFLLSSAKVAFTNMGPRAKPRLFSVSLTQNFQRGRQVWKTHMWVSVGSTLPPGPFLPGSVVNRGLCFLPELQRETPFLTQWGLLEALNQEDTGLGV